MCRCKLTIITFINISAPNFVGSFTQGDFVYFFFRETAVEFINCGKVSGRLQTSILTRKMPTTESFLRKSLKMHFSFSPFRGQAVVSRVARVCKWDKGGPHRYKNRWTTYLKSRLNCSMPGDFPFYFDEIRKYTFVVYSVLLIFWV